MERRIDNLDILNYAARGAVGSDDTKALDTLIQHGADINSRDINGFSALHLAAQHGTAAMVKALIDRGANVNAVDLEGRTALHCAVEVTNSQVYGALIGGGIDVDAKDVRGHTAAQIADDCKLHHSANLLKDLCDNAIRSTNRPQR